MPCRNAAVLLNESHLVNLFHRGDARANLRDTAFSQRNHSLFTRHPLDFRGGPAVHDHFPDAVGQVQQLADRGPPMKSRARAFQTPGTFANRDASPHGGIQAGFLQLLRRIFLRLLAFGTNHAHQALRHDAIQGGDEIIRFNTHVDEASNDVGHVVGVDGGEDQVAGESGLNGDLRGFLIADFADHDLVRIVAQDGTQTASEGQALLLVHVNLRDAADLVFYRIFVGNVLVFVRFDLVDGRVQGGGFAGAGGPSHQDHAVRLTNVAAEAAQFLRGKTDHIESQALKLFGKSLFVENTKDGVLAMARGHNGNTQIDVTPLVLHAETPILRNTALGDVQIAEHLDARENRGMPFLGNRLHSVLQHAIDAVLDGNFRVARFNVDVAGAALEGSEDNGLDEADHRTGGTLARQPVAGNRLVALLLLGGLQGEGFGRLLEHAL